MVSNNPAVNNSPLINIRTDSTTNAVPTEATKEGYLSKSGKWKDGDPTKLKARISEQGVKIAVNSEPTSKSQKVKNFFTTIKLKDADGSAVRLNISSLSKRTHTSVFTILKNGLFSGISKEFLTKRVEKMDKKTSEHITKKVNQQVKQQGGNKAQAVKTIADEINTFKNSNESVRHVSTEKAHFVLEKKCGHVTVISQTNQVLGEGAFGKVTAMKDIFSKQTAWAQKVATADNARHAASAEQQIENEYAIGSMVHEGGQKVGIQETPLVVTNFSTESKGTSKTSKGYITPAYDYDLSSKEMGRKSFTERLIGGYELAQGLNHLHQAGVVHGDIKPANCCMQKGECRLADLGGAITKAQIEQTGVPWGSRTTFYTHPNDISYLKMLGGRMPQGALEFGQKHDVHCLGLTFLTLFSGESFEQLVGAFMQDQIDFSAGGVRAGLSQPKAQEEAARILLDIVRKESPQAAELISGMIAPQNMRFTSAEVLERMVALAA